jgi:hypothetical protein
MEPKNERTCEALVDDEANPVSTRVCGAPATAHVVDCTGETRDEYDVCLDCTPWQEPMDLITVQAIEDANPKEMP